MDHQDCQDVWRAVRAQCALIGQYAHVSEEDMVTAEGVRGIVVALLETLEQILHEGLAHDEDAEDLDPESLEGRVDTLHEDAAERRDAERVLTEAEREEARAHEICAGIITRVFNVW